MLFFSNNVFRQLVTRAIRTDYLENLTGFAWLILQPLVLLAVYAFVFTTIFQTRVADAGSGGFVPYLAVAFWPWTAFSEAILRSSNVISANAALIGKVAFPSELLPLAAVSAGFLMNLAGYLAVLIVLQLTGTSIHWLGVLAALPVLALLYLLASGIALVRQRATGLYPGCFADPASADDVLVFHDAHSVQFQHSAGAVRQPDAFQPDDLVHGAAA